MEAVEITSFKLAGYTCQQFIEANKPIDIWLCKQPGFRSRRMWQQSDGYVFDMLIWDSRDQGTTAMHNLLAEHRDSIIHEMIDQQTVTWTIDTVAHQVIYKS
jgi:hypothetical protein